MCFSSPPPPHQPRALVFNTVPNLSSVILSYIINYVTVLFYNFFPRSVSIYPKKKLYPMHLSGFSRVCFIFSPFFITLRSVLYAASSIRVYTVTPLPPHPSALCHPVVCVTFFSFRYSYLFVLAKKSPRFLLVAFFLVSSFFLLFFHHLPIALS